jgi:hypothetical protein
LLNNLTDQLMVAFALSLFSFSVSCAFSHRLGSVSLRMFGLARPATNAAPSLGVMRSLPDYVYASRLQSTLGEAGLGSTPCFVPVSAVSVQLRHFSSAEAQRG